MKTISRWEFIKMVSKKVKGEYPQMDIYYIIQATFECLADVLKDGNKFIVGSTFSLEPRYREERKCSNFGKEPVVVPGHWEPYFKAYSKLKNACAELDELQRDDESEEAKE